MSAELLPSSEPMVLPYELLLQILRLVPLKQRFASCSLVNQTWQQPVSAATQEVTCPELSKPAAAALAEGPLNSSSSWAQHITSLQLGCTSKATMQQMSCPELLRLELGGFDVQLSPARTDSSGPGPLGVLQGCPDLQDLSLKSCSFSSTALVALTALTRLTGLLLDSCMIDQPDEASSSTRVRQNLRPLLRLTQLQDLHLANMGIELLNELFQWEQRGQQTYRKLANAAVGKVLPSLTSLYIMEDEMVFTPFATPVLFVLTHLRSLELCGLEFIVVEDSNDDIMMGLSELTNLERLVLHSRYYSSAAGDVLDVPELVASRIINDSETILDTRNFLPLLSKMPRLRHLDVSCLGESDWHAPEWSELRKCTALETLRLHHVHLPTGTWPLVFNGAHFRQLRELRVVGDSLIVPFERQCQRMPAECLQQMVTACPSLEVLELRGDGLLEGVPLQPLSQLQHLTSLRVACEDPQAIPALAKLPQLRHLQVSGAVDAVQLLWLTALTQLTCLRREEYSNDKVRRGYWLPAIEFRADDHLPGSDLVWRQLSRIHTLVTAVEDNPELEQQQQEVL